MIKNLLEKKEENEQGFTLIELMVVVLIIAILLAIAIPTFLGAKNTANARAAEANLRNALTAQTSFFTNNNQNYDTAAGGGTAGYAAMSTIESALTWTDSNGSATEPYASNTIYVLDSANQVTAGTPGSTVSMLAVGQDGNCYYVSDASGTVTYGKATQTSSACSTTLPTMSSSTTGAKW